MTDRLKNRAGYVTGGGKGIGRGIALALAREGRPVAVADVDLAAAESVAEGTRGAGGRAIAVTIDVTQADDARALVARTEAEFGRLDIAVHGAGVVSVVPVADLA